MVTEPKQPNRGRAGMLQLTRKLHRLKSICGITTDSRSRRTKPLVRTQVRVVTTAETLPEDKTEERTAAEELSAIRRKLDSSEVLTIEDWRTLADRVQYGLEAPDVRPISPESAVGILEALRRLYALESEHLIHNDYYLTTLRLSPNTSYQGNPEVDSRAILDSIDEATDYIRQWRHTSVAKLSGRVLIELLTDEPAIDPDAVTASLGPYAETLWRVAIRGHYVLEGEPILSGNEPDDGRSTIVYSHEYCAAESFLNVSVGQKHAASVILSLPGSHAPMFPFRGYPELAEFKTMLCELNQDQAPPRPVPGTRIELNLPWRGPRASWDGKYFHGYHVPNGGAAGYWFRAKSNGITMGVTDDQWLQLQRLFREAWDDAALAPVWRNLEKQYGEWENPRG